MTSLKVILRALHVLHDWGTIAFVDRDGWYRVCHHCGKRRAAWKEKTMIGGL